MLNVSRWQRAALIALAGPLLINAVSGSPAPEKPKDHPGRPSHSRFYERERWFYKQREYPIGRIPEHSRLRALQQIQQSTSRQIKINLSAAAASQAIQGTNWISIGPAPIQGGQVAPAQPASGRVTAIAVDPFDPTHWCIGGAQGGVWVTHDTGGTWLPLTDAQASLAMGAIALAPSNPLIVYAGTGEANLSGDSYAGLGLLKSTDGGLSWQLLATN